MPQLANYSSCVGCTACRSVCPMQCVEMKKDNNGFEFPEFADITSCIDCGACEGVCPVLIEKEQKSANVPVAYSAFSKDEKVRMDSSSGGIFSEIAKNILVQNGVVFGAAYNEGFEVEHCCVDNEEELCKLRGAKYSESNLGNTFVEIRTRLKQGQKVLFSSTPCQVAGLKSFLQKEYDNLFCVDFVCHGVPSPMAWKSYIDYRAQKDANGEYPTEINLRSKKTGWSRYQYSNVFKYQNGIEHSVLSSQSLFMKLFVGDYISRPSCGNCKFKGYSHVSDITLGDFWGIWDIDSEMDDNKGTSVILVQSEKGKLLWNEISENIRFKEVSLEQTSQQNPSMLYVSKANAERERVLEMIRDGKITACNKLFVKPKTTVLNRMKVKVKHLVKKIL